ncbi:N-acetylmuramoyl-L-alanine amidase [Motilibacter rhizosphaerae]|uniref:N-acetylmuramoyl-L-alanine amidase n=1 Tax=Motilibacter rhizosphaerae TaxID=598652 RepID=A0A4Q7NW40_9ACTN|nr:N-acetylmuramoyl-L-alanine amidase [Motilibacter rhizosphaerae]RZS91220.1 N-acetylmuramoyl-L-alanine amidase [Motilibacter rhizosphaerae]
MAESAPELLRRGSTGPAVAEVRHKLALLGLLAPAPAADSVDDLASAVFDDEVDRAVRSFQQQRGMTGDGIVGPQTYRALDEARWRLGERILRFAPGHPLTGDDVLELQRRLTDMGFACGRVDGILGQETESGLREFQRNVGLAPDGMCGPQTLKALERLRRTVVGGRSDALREEVHIARRGPRLAGKVVVIDPGHGGRDTGVSAWGLTEAQVVEDLASRVEGRLVATGVQAYLTRRPGMELDDRDRADWANGLQADLLVSLHVDGSASPGAEGVATYFYGSGLGSSGVGERFASLVQREIVARTDLLDCRVHAKTWDLLRWTRMPAVRIEVGYLTSPHDAARLGDAAFRDAVAEAVVVSIQRLYLAADEDAVTGALRLDALALR